MPERALAAAELAHLLGVLAHRDRVRIIEELRNHELDVNALQQLLGVSHSRVSQHLSVLRSNRLVMERREGRHVYYHLLLPDLASWLLDGLKFVASDLDLNAEMRNAIEKARKIWTET